MQSDICRHWFWFTLLANFDFHLCLRINFRFGSLFWLLAVLPYWVLIPQKDGSLSQSLGVLISFGSCELGTC